MTNDELQALLFRAWETECATAQFYAAASQSVPTTPFGTEWDEWHGAAVDRVHVFEELLRSFDLDRGLDGSQRAQLIDAHEECGHAPQSVSSTI